MGRNDGGKQATRQRGVAQKPQFMFCQVEALATRAQETAQTDKQRIQITPPKRNNLEREEKWKGEKRRELKRREASAK